MGSSKETIKYSLEWTVNDLRELFESSAGSAKSKVTKSPLFGDGRWQILFYPNAGTGSAKIDATPTEGVYFSLYLSCEPTDQELEAAINDSGKWVRDGIFKFSFEIRNVHGHVIFSQKEASNHAFSHKTANWGWAQFARRDTVYFNSPPVKAADSFIIVCTITSSSCPPKQRLNLQKQWVPKELMETVGQLLDDPNYSDVEFLLPRRGSGYRSIFASRRLLQRFEYFYSILSPSFLEGSVQSTDSEVHSHRRQRTLSMSEPSETGDFDDSDCDQIDFAETQGLPEHSVEEYHTSGTGLDVSLAGTNGDSDNDAERSAGREASPPPISKISEPPEKDKQAKFRIVIKDVSYSTFKAVLYYLYTDSIYFAPLTSSFPSQEGSGLASPSPSTLRSYDAASSAADALTLPGTKNEWIAEWKDRNPGKPICSPKSVYRLADRLDLHDLKNKAAEQIKKSLTVENIAYEIFSPFTAIFADIRKFEVEFFLQNWNLIRKSDIMKTVWRQIRSGSHPGYEEVWPVIAMNLEFKPQSKDGPAESDVI